MSMRQPFSVDELRAGRMRLLRLVGVVLVLLVLAVTTYRYSESRAMQLARVEAGHRLELFAAAVDGVIRRLEHVPSTVELNPDVRALLVAPEVVTRMRVNAYLEVMSRQVGAIAIFVLDHDGVVVAASNWNDVTSFMGLDLSYRTYFRWAYAGLTGRHFAVGTAQGEPGYYVSRPVRDSEGVVVGVTVVKIGLGDIDLALGALSEPALVADSNGVVIMSPREDWRYTALEPMRPSLQADIERSRLYDNRPIRPFPVAVPFRNWSADATVSLPVPALHPPRGRTQMVRHQMVSRPLERVGWWLVLFSDLSAVHRQALAHAALAVTMGGLLLMLSLYLAQRRRIVRQKLENQAMLEQANLELEETVQRRTQDLSTTNARLREEIVERRNAERTLRAAQDELVQAAKLAVLGQLATGITHELTQPLGAIRTLSGNAAEFLRRGSVETTAKNLSIISRLADQMGAIISPLRTFARKSPAVPARVDVAHAVANALLLLDQKLQRNAIELDNRVAAETAIAWCDPIRLEQVLVNLIGNAADAMASQAGERRLVLSTHTDDAGRLLLCVTDNGPGLAPEVLARVFEPFFTTKPVGEGLGLGLPISRDIVREFGGELSASNAPGGGACFCITLPVPHLETPT
ncbi:sensor histidine kinase [Azoarcus communis SWub3 = DSM 12120]|nr:sensor histidine kinase [Parazoarcus communis SWub3 = DSM 12120]